VRFEQQAHLNRGLESGKALQAEKTNQARTNAEKQKGGENNFVFTSRGGWGVA
jgi:hypothetical protein